MLSTTRPTVRYSRVDCFVESTIKVPVTIFVAVKLTATPLLCTSVLLRETVQCCDTPIVGGGVLFGQRAAVEGS